MVNTAINPAHSCHFIDLDLDDIDECNCSAHAHSTSGLDLQTELFEVGETLLYSKNGYSSFVKLVAVELDADNILSLRVAQPNGDEFVTKKEYLRSPDNPDIGWIPSSVPEYRMASKELSEEDIQKITSLMHLSPLQQEFLSMHHRLCHLPFTIMLRLSKFGILPRRFLKLRNNLPPCTSCLFGQAHCRPWKHKTSLSDPSGVLRSPSINNPGQVVATDQLVSAQPGLVPQEKGQLNSLHIWGATIFVDYSSKWIKVHLMQSATGEETLQAKEAFEHNCNTRGVQPKQYHADNGRFAENTFTEDCKSKGQKLTFCGVGAHHQNGVAKNTIKQLTLTSRTLLLHAQRHWPEYITTML